MGTVLNGTDDLSRINHTAEPERQGLRQKGSREMIVELVRVKKGIYSGKNRVKIIKLSDGCNYIYSNGVIRGVKKIFARIYE